MRTNNHCEGWHIRFNNAIGSIIPDIYQFITALHEEQSSVEILQQQILAGCVTRRVNKEMSVWMENFDAIQYLISVCHNLTERP